MRSIKKYGLFAKSAFPFPFDAFPSHATND